jgi:hypothetical protein
MGRLVSPGSTPSELMNGLTEWARGLVSSVDTVSVRRARTSAPQHSPSHREPCSKQHSWAFACIGKEIGLGRFRSSEQRSSSAWRWTPNRSSPRAGWSGALADEALGKHRVCHVSMNLAGQPSNISHVLDLIDIPQHLE